MYSGCLFLTFSLLYAVAGPVHNEGSRYLTTETFRRMDMPNSTYVINKTGPLGHIIPLLDETGVLDNLYSLMCTLGDNMERDGTEGFKRLFNGMEIKERKHCGEIHIGGFLVYNCQKRTLAHEGGRLFTDTMVEVLKEGYDELFQISDEDDLVNPV